MNTENKIPQTAPQAHPVQSAIDRNAHYELDGVSIADDHVVVGSDGHVDNGPTDKNFKQSKVSNPLKK